jgi:hypothetical protein
VDPAPTAIEAMLRPQAFGDVELSTIDIFA